MRIVFQPCSNGAPMRHYRDTIESPVPLADVRPLLGDALAGSLANLHPDGLVPMWGLEPGPVNVTSHAALQPGDTVLFAGAGRFFSQALVTATWRNAELARALWGTKDGMPDGPTWELMYALSSPVPMDVPYGRVNAVLGYRPTAIPQGFRILDDEKTALVAAELAGVLGDPVVSASEYERSLVPPDGDLEREVVGRARVEQLYLRQRLLGRSVEATCAICGRLLPVDLLVAAHIKKRADCTRDEKLDAGNIVMAACKLGCDELYERGYIAVDERGRVRVTAAAVPGDLKRVFWELDGRECSAFSKGNFRYFAHHREATFRE